jgi:hypothetical protein
MKKLLALLALTIANFAHAEYTLVVPQPPGNGTSVWAAIIAKGLEKHLGEKIVIQHIPGAKDILGFNEYHNKLRFDDKTIMVSHGGNGVSYLVDKIDYDYKYYDSIGMTNLNIVLGRKADLDIKKDRVKIAGGSGLEPDGMAIAMLMCGNLPTKEDYLKCWDGKVVWVNGVPGGERRLGFQRGEFNTTRESVAAWFKFYATLPENKLWFHHGIYNLKTKKQEDDTNFPKGYQFETVFKQIHGVLPKGEFYEAYALERSFRDVLQKALWVNKGNPNTEKLRTALRNMLKDQETMDALEKDTGKYEWIVGTDGNKVVDTLRGNITPDKLKTLVYWHDNAYKFKSVYKPELLVK